MYNHQVRTGTDLPITTIVTSVLSIDPMLITLALFLLFCRFTCVAVCLFQVREFLSKLEELVGKLSYANDPVKAQKPGLQSRTDTLLEDLLKRSFF